MKTFPALGNVFTVSVLICTRNRPEAMAKCVRSLMAQTRLPEELVVVDSSDVPGLEAQLRDVVADNNVRFRYQLSAPGLALQRNVGVSLVQSSVIIFLDDDTVLDPQYVEKIVEVYATDTANTIAGVQGSFIAERELSTLGCAFRRIFQLPGPTGRGRMQASGFPSYIRMPDAIIDVEMICGGNTAYRREVLEQFKWNEAFCGYSYMEDDDYSYRVGRKFRLVQTPSAKMIHEHAPSARDSMARALQMEVRNHALFFKLNMPKTLWSFAAFAWSEIGCCVLTLRAYGLRGLVLRLKAYLTQGGN